MENFYYATLARLSPNVDITPRAVTTRNKGVPIDYTSGQGWAIPRGAKNAALACRWMKAMTNAPTWVKAAKARMSALKALGRPWGGLYTANSVADEQILKLYEKTRRKGFDDAVRLNVRVQKYAFAIPASPASAEFQQAWQDAVNRVLAGQQSPKAALKRAQSEAQKAINKAK